MRNTKKVLVGMLAGAMILASTVGTSFARGGPGMGGYGKGMWGPGNGRCMGLGICNPNNPSLSQEQKDKLFALREAYLRDVTPLQNELAAKKLELRNLWAAQNPDQARITEKQREINRLQERIQERATKYRIDCQQVLNQSTTSGN